MNLFVALFTILGFAVTTGVWFVGAYTIVKKVYPFVMERINSVRETEETEEFRYW